MVFNAEQQAFRKLFADSLREKVDSSGVHLAVGEELQIAEGFVEALNDAKHYLVFPMAVLFMNSC